jgi:hypothetical protein
MRIVKISFRSIFEIPLISCIINGKKTGMDI